MIAEAPLVPMAEGGLNIGVLADWVLSRSFPTSRYVTNAYDCCKVGSLDNSLRKLLIDQMHAIIVYMKFMIIRFHVSFVEMV